MDTRGILRKAGVKIKSQAENTGAVREYRIGRGRRLFQITTFCPEKAGPGPTNLYLIEDDALILVDTGAPTSIAKTLFYLWLGVEIPEDVERLDDDYSEQELIEGIKLAGHDLKDINFIFLTHGHADHYLLGKKLADTSGAKLVAHVLDAGQISNPWNMLELFYRKGHAMEATGAPLPKWQEKLPFSLGRDEMDMSLKVDYAILKDGRFEAGGFSGDNIWVRRFPGHSPGAIGVFVYDDAGEQAFLLCGDTILYPITPLADDLLEYLRTLRSMKQLEQVALTLPGHGRTIANLPQRIATIEKHHKRRLKLTYDACKTPASIWQIATQEGLFDTYVHPNKFNPLAGREAYIHVELLEMAGGLYRSDIREGVHYYRNSGEKFSDVYRRVMDTVNDPSKTAFRRI